MALTLLVSCCDSSPASTKQGQPAIGAPLPPIVTPLRFVKGPCPASPARTHRGRVPPAPAAEPPQAEGRQEERDPVAESYLRIYPPRSGMMSERYR